MTSRSLLTLLLTATALVSAAPVAVAADLDLTAFGLGVDGLSDFTFAGDGRAYATDGSSLWRGSAKGGFKRFTIRAGGERLGDTRMAAGPDGTLWLGGYEQGSTRAFLIRRGLFGREARRYKLQPRGLTDLIAFGSELRWFDGVTVGRVNASEGSRIVRTFDEGAGVSLVQGSDGALYTDGGLFVGAGLSRVAADGALTQFRGTNNSPGQTPAGLGGDGRVWVAGEPGELLRLNTAGGFDKFVIPGAPLVSFGESFPLQVRAITPGPDGATWFTAVHDVGGGFNPTADDVVGRVDAKGAFEIYALPNGQVGALPEVIQAGPDGRLWLLLKGTNEVASFPAPAGVKGRVRSVLRARATVTGARRPTVRLTIGCVGALGRWCSGHVDVQDMSGHRLTQRRPYAVEAGTTAMARQTTAYLPAGRSGLRRLARRSGTVVVVLRGRDGHVRRQRMRLGPSLTPAPTPARAVTSRFALLSRRRRRPRRRGAGRRWPQGEGQSAGAGEVCCTQRCADDAPRHGERAIEQAAFAPTLVARPSEATASSAARCAHQAWWTPQSGQETVVVGAAEKTAPQRQG